MVQVKKAEVRDSILKSAFRLFKRKGYVTTTTAQIAAGAKVSESNLYIYFDSKFEILFALCDPWMRERIARLERHLAGERQARRRLQIILTALWLEMPREDSGFANNLMQALATTARREGYRPELLRWKQYGFFFFSVHHLLGSVVLLCPTLCKRLQEKSFIDTSASGR